MAPGAVDPIEQPAAAERGDASQRKRKREDLDEADPKLQEFLEVMNPGQAPKRMREQQEDVTTEPLPPPEDEGGVMTSIRISLPHGYPNGPRRGESLARISIPVLKPQRMMPNLQSLQNLQRRWQEKYPRCKPTPPTMIG